MSQNPVSESGPEFLVVGAGLAGLAVATTLHGAGREVMVLERADQVGGEEDGVLELGAQDAAVAALLSMGPEPGLAAALPLLA